MFPYEIETWMKQNVSFSRGIVMGPEGLEAHILESAKTILQKDGHLNPMVFIQDKQGLAILDVSVFFERNLKNFLSDMVLFMLNQTGGLGVCMLSEAWMVVANNGKEAEELKAAAQKGLEDHPDKTEVVMLHTSWQNGASRARLLHLIRDTNGKPAHLLERDQDNMVDAAQGRLVFHWDKKKKVWHT